MKYGMYHCKYGQLEKDTTLCPQACNCRDLHDKDGPLIYLLVGLVMSGLAFTYYWTCDKLYSIKRWIGL